MVCTTAQERLGVQVFGGGAVLALCGRAEIDLREANLPPACVALRLLAIGGAITLRIPVGWPVTISGTPAFGLCTVRTQNAEIAMPGGAALRIRCRGLFGSITITN